MSKVRWLDENCIECDRQLNSWDEKLSKTLQYRNKKCESCIAKEYGMTTDTLRTTMQELYGLLPCQGI